jgi:sugar transferase (PEP-CTERM/EpsH1 system associated)
MRAGEASLHVMHVVRMGDSGGGMEKGLINVARRLPEEFCISICALDTQEDFSACLHRPGSQFYLLPGGQGAGRPDLKWVFRLVRLFRDTGPDVVHSHNWGTFVYTVLAARLAGVPIIHGEHGKNLHELDERNPPKDWARRFLGRSIERLITVSDPLRREWIEKYEIPPRKAVYIANGVDLERFRPGLDQAECRKRFDLPQEAWIVGSVARLDPIKNFGLLVRAMPLLQNADRPVVVALLGDGPCRNEIEALAAKLGVCGRLYLPGKRPDVEHFLGALDVFTLPSLCEGMSNVVLEAMAAGVPVVCPDIPAHHALIDPANGEGILLDPCTEHTLAANLLDVLASPERRKSLAERSRAKTERHFTLDEMARRHAELYREVVGSR